MKGKFQLKTLFLNEKLEAFNNWTKYTLDESES
jgi:hypothetical protein